MFKSIFAKQFATFFCIVFVSILLLGISFTTLFQNHAIEAKKKILSQQGKKLSEIYMSNYWEHLDDFFIAPRLKDELTSELEKIHEFLDVSLIITDNNFQTFLASTNIYETAKEKTILNEVLYKTIDGEVVFFKGNLGGIFSEEVISVATPIFTNEEFKGVVLISSPMSEINKTISDVYKATIYCTVITGVVAFFLVYIVTKTITKPISQINQAAKIVAGGDFEKRLLVKNKDEIAELATSFNNMAESLSKQERLRRDLIANVSHDIRSPLTSMKGFLQAIIDGTIPNEAQEKYLYIVLEETDRLTKLSNDLIDISKIENLKIELNKSDFDINALIRKTVATFENQIITKQIEINIIFAKENTIVSADHEIVQRIIYNLLDNAIKFTPLNGNIKIETSITQNQKSKPNAATTPKVNISIKDSGIGISSEDQKYIFNRFFKSDTSRGEDKKGSGLGLSIVKEFVKAHDENISVISEPNKGCEFIFSLKISVPKSNND